MIMKSKSNIKAKKALQRLNKSGDEVLDGLNSNQPALYPGTNVVDNYRAREAADITDMKQKRFIDNLELSRRLMELDNNLYGVMDYNAHEMIDYIERKNFDVVQELDMEYQIKKNELKKKAKELASINMQEYLTEDDYKRVALYKVKQINLFGKRLEYLRLIIKTIKDYARELKESSEENIGANQAIRQYNNPIVGTNWNSDTTAASKLK